MIVLNDFFDQCFLIFGPFWSTSSFIVIWVIIFVWINLIVRILIIKLIFHMVLFFMVRNSRVVALGIVRIITFIRRIIRVIILVISIFSVGFLISKILFHQFVNHGVVILHGDEIFSTIFDALHFDLFDYLFFKYCNGLLGLKNDVFFIPPFLVDDGTWYSVLTDIVEVGNDKGDASLQLVFESTDDPRFGWACHELSIYLFIFNFLLKITPSPSTL